MVNPYDVTSITAAIRTLDHDDDMRRNMIADGRAQAAKFTPAIYRERLQQLYKSLI